MSLRISPHGSGPQKKQKSQVYPITSMWRSNSEIHTFFMSNKCSGIWWQSKIQHDPTPTYQLDIFGQDYPGHSQDSAEKRVFSTIQVIPKSIVGNLCAKNSKRMIQLVGTFSITTYHQPRTFTSLPMIAYAFSSRHLYPGSIWGLIFYYIVHLYPFIWFMSPFGHPFILNNSKHD